MRKVITGSLNGNAYQFEEGAFTAIKSYLDAAARHSAGNADRRELLSDLEQSIADKCDGYLGRHKNVISDEEARLILRQMGPVDCAAAGPDEAGAASRHGPSASAAGPLAGGRRLYRIPSHGMMGGVCAGLAGYFGMDVVWVRLIYILLTFCTGIWFFIWLAQLIITPRAVTAEEIAVAQGMREAFGR
jgi:phage shock protein PspC (stress-responsive transcriptional regulator)